MMQPLISNHCCDYFELLLFLIIPRKKIGMMTILKSLFLIVPVIIPPNYYLADPQSFCLSGLRLLVIVCCIFYNLYYPNLNGFQARKSNNWLYTFDNVIRLLIQAGRFCRSYSSSPSLPVYRSSGRRAMQILPPSRRSESRSIDLR